jgi:hypothetical protein
LELGGLDTIAPTNAPSIQQLSFPTSPIREYWVESTSDPEITPFGPSSPVHLGDGSIMTLDLNNAGFPRLLYRIRVAIPASP